MGERDKKAIAQEIVPDGVIGKNIGIGYIYSSFSTKNIVVDHVPCAEVYFFSFCWCYQVVSGSLDMGKAHERSSFFISLHSLITL